MVRVTYPAWSGVCSAGVDVTSGVARTNTSASRTTSPRVSETWTRTETGRLRETTRLGVNRTPSMTRRAGNTTLETGIEVRPLASLICPAGPLSAVVVVVDDVVVVVGVVVVVEPVVLVLVLVLVVSVDVDPVVLEVDVESAASASGPALPALAK